MMKQLTIYGVHVARLNVHNTNAMATKLYVYGKKSNSFCNFAIHKQVLTFIISEVWRHWKIGTCETRQA